MCALENWIILKLIETFIEQLVVKSYIIQSLYSLHLVNLFIANSLTYKFTIFLYYRWVWMYLHQIKYAQQQILINDQDHWSNCILCLRAGSVILKLKKNYIINQVNFFNETRATSLMLLYVFMSFFSHSIVVPITVSCPIVYFFL